MNALRSAQRALAQTYAVVSPIARPVGWEVCYRVGDTVRVDLLDARPYDSDAARVEAAQMLPTRTIVVPWDGDEIPAARLVVAVA